MRLCANINAELHLIKPLGFTLNNKNLRRASLDYFDMSKVFIHEEFDEFLSKNKTNIYLTDTQAKNNYSDCNFNLDDSFVFGSESKGINKIILDNFDDRKQIYIPMYPNIRSINICNSVSIIAYECLRQNKFMF
ncbi:MAG: TrmH family RNA methyltransferase [Dehalococcoidia bacterium]